MISGTVTKLWVVDRLSIVTLVSSIYFLQVWMILPEGPIPREALFVLSIIGIAFPGLWQCLFLNAAVFVAAYLVHSPVASNNQTTAFFLCVLVLVALTPMVLNPARDRDRAFNDLAQPGRWLLAILYFYGIYHKINVDFLDPQVSCAVVLYSLLAVDFGLQDWRLGQYAAIYSTFIIEGVAMIALFSRRFKRLGMMVGIPFHIIIGWTGYAYYKDFSTIVLVLYALFLPRVAVQAALDDLVRIAGGGRGAVRLGGLVFLAVAGVTALPIGLWYLAGGPVSLHDAFVWPFSIYSLAFYAFAVAYVPWYAPSEPVAPRGWTAIVPLLFLVNGMSPYLGLKTESSIAMYSNLHTEAGQTNHLFHGVIPGLFRYQDTVVQVVAANAPWMMERHGETWLVRYELDRMLARSPALEAVVLVDGQRQSTSDNWTNTYAETPWLLRKFLIFKPVDFQRPKVCTH